jgi:FKBP-type peptidyl-prolyl cis-trans isomerase FklB
MQKPLTIVVQLLAAGMMLLGNAPAQQTPAATTAPSTQPASAAPATQAAPAKTPSAAAAKKPATTAKTATPFALTTQKQKASYALGMKIGADLKRQGVSPSVDAAITARGLKDAMAGTKALLTEDQEKAALMQLQTEVRARQQAMMQEEQAKAHEASAPARKAGEAFLAENKSKEGVVTLPSGMQYKILTAGTGPKPIASDTVTCNYKGTLLNGKEFDSSYKRGQPSSFPVSGVIKGWTEALQLMPVGSKWQLFIPADLAYGDSPRPGGDIVPGDTLIFEVELLSIGEQKK